MLAICVPCQREYRCEKNEVVVEIGGELWSLDKYKCYGCGHEMIPAPRPAQNAFAPYRGEIGLNEERAGSPPEVILS